MRDNGGGTRSSSRTPASPPPASPTVSARCSRRAASRPTSTPRSSRTRATASIVRGSRALGLFGTPQTVVVALGGGSSMDSAKAISLHAINGGAVLALGYHARELPRACR